MPTKTLPCPLTDGEILHKALASADLGVEAERLDEERASLAKNYREALKECRSRRRALDRAIRDRSEMRSVEVRDIHDGRRLAVDTIRLDTGEIIGSRAMTAAERQMPIPDFAPPAPPAPVEAPRDRPHIMVPAGRVEVVDLSQPAEVPRELADAASATPPRVMTEPVLSDEERAEVRRQYEEQQRVRSQAEVERAFAPAPPRARQPRVSRPAPLAAEAPPADPVEARFSLLELEEAPAPAEAKPEPAPAPVSAD